MEIMIGSPLPSSLQLKSIKKYNVGIGNISTRVRSAEETLTQIIPLCKKIGVTRISDITYMDKLYLPNYTAVLPGTEDTIWVYGGKGPTKIHARTGALMESIRKILFLVQYVLTEILSRGHITSYQKFTTKYCILMK